MVLPKCLWAHGADVVFLFAAFLSMRIYCFWSFVEVVDFGVWGIVLVPFSSYFGDFLILDMHDCAYGWQAHMFL